MGAGTGTADETRPVSPICRSGDDVIAALRARKAEIGISHVLLDELAGLAAGHGGKIVGASRRRRPTVYTLGHILQALGCGLIIVEDPEAIARMSGRWAQRQARHDTSTKRKVAA